MMIVGVWMNVVIVKLRRRKKREEKSKREKKRRRRSEKAKWQIARTKFVFLFHPIFIFFSFLSLIILLL